MLRRLAKLTTNYFNQNELQLSPLNIKIRIKMIKTLNYSLQVRFNFTQIIKTNLIHSVQFQIDWNKYFPKHTILGQKRKCKMEKERVRDFQDIQSPRMCMTATMAGWSSMQENSIQGRASHSYPLRNLCKNYEKNDVWFSSHSKFKQTTSLSLFSFLVWKKIRGERIIWEGRKNKYYIILLSYHIPATCLHVYKRGHAHTVYS